MKKIFILGFIIGVLMFFVLLTRAFANVPDAVCDNGVHTHNPHCEEVVPSPEPSISPEPTDTPEATPSATPAVTAPPSQFNDGLSDGRHTAPDGLGCAVHECKSPYDGAKVGWK